MRLPATEFVLFENTDHIQEYQPNQIRQQRWKIYPQHREACCCTPCFCPQLNTSSVKVKSSMSGSLGERSTSQNPELQIFCSIPSVLHPACLLRKVWTSEKPCLLSLGTQPLRRIKSAHLLQRLLGRQREGGTLLALTESTESIEAPRGKSKGQTSTDKQ